MSENQPQILGADGKPARVEHCPRCGAPRKQFVPTSGFGRMLRVSCGNCGEFIGEESADAFR
jgi:hypothetical protein